MSPQTGEKPYQPKRLEKCPTGIKGIDEITDGGIPRGRVSLIIGEPGTGKTFFAMEFLVRGAVTYNEPGLYLSFEENKDELVDNFSSIGFDLKELMNKQQIKIDKISVDLSPIPETGEFTLDGLFIRLESAIDSIKAKRVAIDTIEALFVGNENHRVIRSELVRLFDWLKSKGVTTVLTGEKGSNTMTRHGMEEYVSDCVLLLNQTVQDHVTYRSLRIIKYRGSSHVANECPFLISSEGLTVVPLSSVFMDYAVSSERISTGVPRFDTLLNGGYYVGSSILITGTAGSGKSSFAAYFAASICKNGGRCLYISFEESPMQLIRNMRSIGLDLAPFIESGLLTMKTTPPGLYGLEMHLATTYRLVNSIRPQAVILDPISNLITIGSSLQVRSMLGRLINYLKTLQITIFMTDLAQSDTLYPKTEAHISSMTDTWFLVRNVEMQGERNRLVSIIKSRGMDHSNQVNEFTLSKNGIEIADMYSGTEGMVFGSARLVSEARDLAKIRELEEELDIQQKEYDIRQKALEAKIAALREELILNETRYNRSKISGQRKIQEIGELRELLKKYRQG